MFVIRESFSDGRVATVAVRLRFSMGGMLGMDARLCQLPRFAAAVGWPVESGGQGPLGAEGLRSPRPAAPSWRSEGLRREPIGVRR